MTKEDDYKGDTNADGMPHGKGVWTYECGHMYTGDFVNGKMDGQGVLVMGDYTYEGGFKKDKVHGTGVLRHKKGWLHKGKWENDRCVE